MHTAIGEPATNAESVLEVARECHDEGVGLAVFPELTLSGYSIEDILMQDALLDAVEDALLDIVAASADLLPVIGDIRRIPSALGLSYLAAGRFDASLIVNTKPWDIAASELIAREAGAQVSSPGPSINESAVFAGPALLNELVAAISTSTVPLSPPAG